MSRSIKALVLAGALSMAAVLAAGGGVNGVDVHASAAPVCDAERCPVVAGDGGPGTAGDNNGRAELTTDTHRMFAGGRGGMTGEV
jgi:hypothetical protein